MNRLQLIKSRVEVSLFYPKAEIENLGNLFNLTKDSFIDKISPIVKDVKDSIYLNCER